MQNTDPIGALHKVVPPSPHQPAHTIAPASAKLRPFLGYVRKYRHEGGISDHTSPAHRGSQG